MKTLVPAAKRVELSTGALEYFTMGEGRPLVYLHSSAGLAWTKVLRGLAKTHALHVPVLPGFDGTAHHAGVGDMAGLAGVVGEFIDKTFGTAVDVIGHSLGGRVALWLASQRPQCVDHLVLEAPSGFAPDGSFPTDADTLRRRMFAHPEKRPRGKRSPHIAANRESTASYLKGATFDADLQQHLAGIRHMTLLLHGTADLICTKEGMRDLKAKLPRAFLMYVWDAAHAIEVDQPERMLALTGDFLSHSEAFVVNWG